MPPYLMLGGGLSSRCRCRRPMLQASHLACRCSPFHTEENQTLGTREATAMQAAFVHVAAVTPRLYR
eukprot:CAMPEP_0204533950 /NCGR_PEP_ID=MMETSP0661-20131031/12593_1 /ASSEMBLY_ACC=CAM_ASM_000606 /TAXON_ID=109239 /ORGANISM="Alexandrium margalefi, Strain AMGDE01CS-322" /LENGTH=66 /DNA_ID=CAMNT_0051540371 /DNA_START=19 /DNA_END=216 /DNA_ORIENTATION=-